jgi:hypothetical protein
MVGTYYGPCGVRCKGGVNLVRPGGLRAGAPNSPFLCGIRRQYTRGTGTRTARPKVPMPHPGANYPIRLLKQGNARVGKVWVTGAATDRSTGSGRKRPVLAERRQSFIRWQEPDESRRSCPDLSAPRGEILGGDSAESELSADDRMTIRMAARSASLLVVV